MKRYLTSTGKYTKGKAFVPLNIKYMGTYWTKHYYLIIMWDIYSVYI